MRIPSILLVVIMFLMAGCRHEHEYDSRLIQAEGLVESYPDSALRLLETVDTTKFAEPDMALYALVKTETHCIYSDKPTNKPTALDSLIRIAVDYFEKYNDSQRSSRAYRAQGIVYYYGTFFNPDLISNSMRCLLKAKDIAERNGLNSEAGHACKWMAEVMMNKLNNNREAYNYAKEEFEYFKRCGNAQGIMHALTVIATFEVISDQLEEAMRNAEALIDSARNTGDEKWYIMGLRLKGYVESARNNHRKAYNLFTEVCRSKWATTNDTLHRGAELRVVGDSEGGIAIISSAKGEGSTWRDGILADYYAGKGEYQTAYQFAVQRYNAEAPWTIQIFNNTLSSQLVKSYELTQQLDKAELERTRWRMWFIIVIALVVVAGIISFFVWRYRRQQRAIDDKIRIARDLEETLGQSREELERIRSDYDVSRTEADRSATMVRTLLHGRYEMLETLTELVTRNSVIKGGRTRLADAVTRLIEDYSGNTERYAELERQADALFDNLISDFRRTFQGLKDADYRLYLFSVMGLSNQTIAVFLKEDRLTAVYGRRQRLKERIKAADPVIRDRFLPYL